MLDTYKHAFKKLNANKSTTSWTADTTYRGPYKPFLLLAIMDLISVGEISENFVELDERLFETFRLYWDGVMGDKRLGTIGNPIFYLQRDGFWQLLPKPGQEQVAESNVPITSIRKLKETFLGGQFTPELFALLQEARARDELRQVLTREFFAPELWSKLMELGQIAVAQHEYSRQLLSQPQNSFEIIREEPEGVRQYQQAARSAAFRNVVTKAYQHRCAMCGLRILTPENHTIIIAAHIVPWSDSYNDDPRNGMALCQNHHWMFDKGLLTATEAYTIRVSPTVETEQNSYQDVIKLRRKPLHLPTDRSFWPAQVALAWHRKNVYRTE